MEERDADVDVVVPLRDYFSIHISLLLQVTLPTSHNYTGKDQLIQLIKDHHSNQLAEAIYFITSHQMNFISRSLMNIDR
jgi:uncharacterized protein (DUF952 family)